MPYFHVVALLPGGERKTVNNKTEAEVITSFVTPFVQTSTITTKWGQKSQRRQALQLMIYRTEERYAKSTGTKFDAFIKNKKNRFKEYADKVKAQTGQSHRVFVVMPLQGEKYGDQEQQRILKEYDERFDAIEAVLGGLDCYAIRIDKEAPLEGVVDTIKDEIRKAKFIIADLTDERPSCYFEAGYADALGRPVIYVASKQSVVQPGQDTTIHFDIHRNINFFSNHTELKEKVKTTFEKNKAKLLAEPTDAAVVAAAA